MSAGIHVPRLAMSVLFAASTVTVAVGAKDLTQSTCSSVAFRGFDTRLDATLLARVDLRGSAVTGFEVAGGKPLIAFEHRLVGVDGARLLSMPSVDKIDGLAVDASGVVLVQSGTRVRRLTKEKLEPVRTLAEGTRLHNSGNVAFLQSQRQGGTTLLTVVSDDAREGVSPLRIDGAAIGSATWNSVGLAVAAGDTLIAWTAGSQAVTRLRRDEGLRSARDVNLIAPDRAVVALPGTLALVTDRGIAPLALISARARWANDALYVLDETLGVVWKVSGLEKLGTAASDKAHVRSILTKVPPNAAETDPRFLEAARILGCEGARAARSKVR